MFSITSDRVGAQAERFALRAATRAARIAGCFLLTVGFSFAFGFGSASLSAETLVIRGGTVHSMVAGSTPAKADLLIDNGRIVSVGSVTAPAGATIIDASGLDVYPGFVDALNQVGLVEISSISATVDSSEMGTYNPHLTAASTIHPASEVIPVTRETGVSYSLVTPTVGTDGVIAGRAALVQMDGWTVEEMAVTDSAAMYVLWPQVRTRTFNFATFTLEEAPYSEAKKTADKRVDELRDWLDAARHYAKAESAQSQRLVRNLQLEWLAKVLPEAEGGAGMKVIIAADSKTDIEAAVAFAKEQKLDMILAGGRDAWKVKSLLADSDIPVILGLVAQLPNETDDAYDRPFSQAGELAAAGITLAFGSGAAASFGPDGPHGSRTVPFEAGMATAYGLDRETALMALTRNPAVMLGLDQEMGTLEVGKLGNVIVVDGDPLEIRSQVKHLILRGREVSTDNRQRRLYQLYRSRPLPTSPR